MGLGVDERRPLAQVEDRPHPVYNDAVSMRLLAIKIGNSNVNVGVFEGADLLAHWRIHTEIDQTADEYALVLNDWLSQAGLRDGWRGAIVVSVVPPLTDTFQELCRRYIEVEPLIAGPKLRTGMPIRYQDPRSLGADRLVAAVAAKVRYGAPLIVIDFGTATTFNVVNRAGEFVGGAIAPGLVLAADALYESTAQLPRIDLTVPPRAIATNTIEGMQSGILFGYLGLIEGMVRRLREEMHEPNARVVATGGLARLIAPHTRILDHVEPDLIMHGLRILFEMNVGEAS